MLASEQAREAAAGMRSGAMTLNQIRHVWPTAIDALIAELNDERMRCAQADNAVEQMATQRKVLEQALEALQTCRIRSVTEGEVREVTPKIITNAIIVIQEQLK